MSDISHILEAKSDQLNAIDILGGEKIITITSVDVTKEGVTVHYEGEGKKPWKIGNKTVPRIFNKVWDCKKRTEPWVGKMVALHYDPTVIYAGESVGGIRPHAVSHIDAPMKITTREVRGPKAKTFTIQPLRMEMTQAKPTRIEFSMETYTRAIEKIISESETHDELQTRFDRMSDWRKQASQTDRPRATELRQRVESRLSELADA